MRVVGSACTTKSIINSLRFGSERFNNINVGIVDTGEVRETTSLLNLPDDMILRTSSDVIPVSENVRIFTTEALEHSAEVCGVTPHADTLEFDIVDIRWNSIRILGK